MSEILYNSNRCKSYTTEKGEIMEKLLTSSEARALLGNMSPSTFKIYVDSERIRKITPPGKKQGKYVREDVESLAKELLPFTLTEKTVNTQKASKHKKSYKGATDWAQSRDLPYMLAYDYEYYGPENTVDISITRKWWEKNPYMARLLFNAEDRRDIWGGITIIPMKEETIFRILRDEMTEKEITPDDIEIYEPGKKYYGYVASATVKEEHAAHFRGLLQSVFDFWCEQYPDIQIIKLYAYAASEKGWDLIKRLFFAPRYDLGKNAFELNPLQRNPSKYLKIFQECLRSKGASIDTPI
jgi:hypothetical protein